MPTEIDVNALPNDDWETVVSAGIALAQHMDAHRWQLGDLAGRVEKRYGTDALGNFASEIGMARKTTLKEYRRVSARFDPAIRMAFSEALSWSHFQAAMVAGDDAELWLAKAADDGLTVNALARAIKEATGKPVPPKLVWSGRARVEEHGTYIELALDGWPHELLPYNSDFVTVKVYEVAE